MLNQFWDYVTGNTSSQSPSPATTNTTTAPSQPQTGPCPQNPQATECCCAKNKPR